ncbi:hypothetical protein KVT40_003398 [Elsinoe batatas]|uniref:Uncharacterized protein n=1 Tax=Elsinoe batatas TaxID=2601811 RepID=A0A8K0PJH5_9PEZI|nr:hypothetical protein KVT40_003398 [Elsinoe batatas]
MPLRLAFLDAVTRDMSYISSKITPGKLSSPTSPDGTSDPRLEAWVASQTVPLSQPPSEIPTTSAGTSASVRPGLQRSQTTLTRTSCASQRVYESRMSSDYSIQRSTSRRKRSSVANQIPEDAQQAVLDVRPADVRRSNSSTARPGMGARGMHRSYDAATLSRQGNDSRRISGDSRDSGGRSPGPVGTGAGYGTWVVPEYPKLPRTK